MVVRQNLWRAQCGGCGFVQNDPNKLEEIEKADAKWPR